MKNGKVHYISLVINLEPSSALFYSNPRMSLFVSNRDFMSIVLLFLINQHSAAHMANINFCEKCPQNVFKVLDIPHLS